MKCIKCDFENGNNNFCKNCGAKLEPINQMEGNNRPKKRKSKGLVRALIVLALIALIVVIIIVINKSRTNQSATFSDPFEEVDNIILTEGTIAVREYETKESELTKLENKYKNKEITADEYINELNNVVYNLEYFPQGDSNGINYLVKKTHELRKKLNAETLIKVYNKATLGNVEWETEENNVKPASNDLTFAQDAGDVNKLTNAILSKNKNFIVYYSTRGKNATKESEAKRIADNLEEYVSQYNDSSISTKRIT